MLCALACEAAGGTLDQSLDAGCAVEMIHTYSLIHDDLPAMDDDDLRRGLPTCHVRYGEALAILAGDALLTLAFELVATSYPPRTAAVSCAEMARGAGAVGMVGGQVLDLTSEGRVPGRMPETVADLEAIHRAKTGALFRTALRLGLYAAQGENPTGFRPALADALDQFAAAFGLLFQVTDDLLDSHGDAAKTGKRVNKDVARGKFTYPGFLGESASRAFAAELAHRARSATESLGPAGLLLADLAQAVVERDR
jgi:geranylgeranyl diphosphate synthase type II